MSTKAVVRMFIIIGVLFIAVTFFLIPSNTQVRVLGGSTTVNLPQGEKLVTITWKKDSLWYCTRKMKNNEQAETYIFKEDSAFGVLEGTVTICEHK